jgi:hypothetical protein
MTKRPIVFVLALTGACSAKKSDEPASSPPKPLPAAAPAASPPPAQAPTSAAKAARPRRWWIDEVGRGNASCEFTGWQGDGDKRRGSFKIGLPPGHGNSHHIQTYIFYYDKAGKQLADYPHFTTFGGESSIALGLEGKDVPANVATVECEITSIRNDDDKTYWFDYNLLPCCSGKRPKGGLTEAQLKAYAGEKLTVEVLDPKKPHVRVNNVGDKAIRAASIAFLTFAPDGEPVTAEANYEGKLEPGASRELDVELSGPDDNLAKLRAATEVEAAAPLVYFTDDTPAWNNQNLAMHIPH